MNRKKLKEWAKNALHRNYWKSVLVVLVLLATTFLITYFISYGIGIGMGYGISFGIGFIVTAIEENMESGAIVIAIFLILLMFAIGTLLTLTGVAGKAFLANPLEIGCKKFLCKSLYKQDTKLSEMGSAFSKDYKNIAKVMFVRDIYIGLWALLGFIVYMIFGMVVLYGGVAILMANEHKLSEVVMVLWLIFFVVIVYVICFASFIPMYIKVLQYLFMPYILSENPDMPRKQVFELSKKMIQGDKWNVFVMHLSFMGWLILSGCTCYILQILYVGPYMEYTTAAYYEALKQKLD